MNGDRDTMRQTQGSIVCPSCGKLIGVGEPECPFCGAWLPGQGCLLEEDCVEGENPPCVDIPDRERDTDQQREEREEARRDRESDR